MTSSANSVATVAPNLVVTVTVEAVEAADEIHIHAGGQGFWVARMIGLLGVNSKIFAPLGGETGQVLRGLLAAENVDAQAVSVDQRNGSYIDDRRSGERLRLAEVTGGTLTRHEEDDLYGAALAAGISCHVAVLTGPQPSNAVSHAFYQRLAADLRANGVFVVADLVGDALDAALAGGVDLLKISDEELLDTGRIRDRDIDAVSAALSTLKDDGACNVLVSRADEPALALLDDQLIEVTPPRFEELDSKGAGDSMTAAIAAACAREMELGEAIRLGTAAGSLNVSRRGLGSGRREDIEKLAHEVGVREL